MSRIARLVSQGRDEKEALENIREAITAWMWAEGRAGWALTGQVGSHCVMTKPGD